MMVGYPMRWLCSLSALFLTLCDPMARDVQSFQSPSRAQPPAPQQSSGNHIVAERGAARAEPSNEGRQDTEYRPAREIKKFLEPSVLLKGTAQQIGLETRPLASVLEQKFLKEFAFLQSDFTFDKKTYETWEIGVFECDAWTVGSNYPIAFHIQCVAGSMDEPRNWQYATLGYGPRDKIEDMVSTTLDSIVSAYATFVRKARKLES